MTSLSTPGAAAPHPAHGPRRWSNAAFTLDLRSLAAARIAVGTLVVLDAILRMRDLRSMFAADGCLPPDAVQALAPAGSWSLAWLGDAAWSGPALLTLEAAAGLALALGWRTRLATVMAWIVVTSVWRRTAPAANGGDVWLTLQLVWGCFLPWGAVWSCDAGRATPPRAIAVCTVGTAAVVLQLAAVYLGAGLAKVNPDWLGGDAVGHALAADHHGTAVGDFVARQTWLTRPLGPAIVALELATPLVLLAAPQPTVRIVLMTLVAVFHVASGITMSLGLFPAVALAAWLPLVPARSWRTMPASTASHPGRSAAAAQALCGGLVILAGVDLAARLTAGRPPGEPLAAVVQAVGVAQPWDVFATVPAQRQWVYAVGRRADGTLVDVLRAGRIVAADPPADGFLGLPHHRWRELCWRLPRPGMEPLARAMTAGLARVWNEEHPNAERLVWLELRAARRGDGLDDAVQDVLVAAWPPRSPLGAGGLERLLEDAGPDGPQARE